MAVFFTLEECFFFAPVFGNAHIPMPVRIAIALMFTFILYPSHKQKISPCCLLILFRMRFYCSQRNSDWRCGWVCSFNDFAAFNMAGFLISNQMGLDMAMVV